MRTRSQPESPSGFAVLESRRVPRPRRNPSQSSRAPSSRPATRSTSVQPDPETEQQNLTDGDAPISTVESEQPESSRIRRRRQRGAASRATPTHVDDSPSSTAHPQSLHSVEIEHNTTTKGKEPEGGRTRQTKTTSVDIDHSATTKGKEPEGGRTRQTRTASVDIDHSATAKGKQPEGGLTRRQTRSTSVDIDHSATAKGKQPKGGRTTRQTGSTLVDNANSATAKGKEPEGGRTTRQTRSASVDIGHSATTKGKEPEGGRATRQTRSTSRKTVRHGADTATATAPQSQQSAETEHDATAHDAPENSQAPRKAKPKSRKNSRRAKIPPSGHETRSKSNEPDQIVKVSVESDEPSIAENEESNPENETSNPENEASNPENEALNTADSGESNEADPTRTNGHGNPSESTPEPWTIPLPESRESTPKSPLHSLGLLSSSPLGTRSATPSEPEWEDLLDPAHGGGLVLDDSTMAELVSALALHDEQEATLAVETGHPAGESAQDQSTEDQSTQEQPAMEVDPGVSDTTGMFHSNMSVVSEESEAMSIVMEVDVGGLQRRFIALALHERVVEIDDLAMPDVVDEVPASPIDLLMDDVEPYPIEDQYRPAENEPVVNNDMDMVDAMPIDIVPLSDVPRMETNSILHSYLPSCPVAPLVWPSLPPPISGLDPETVRLIDLENSRKRHRPTEDDTPPAKRRDTGGPVTPVRRLRRESPLPFISERPWRHRALPIDAREQRRRREVAGRIHSTLFQLPDYVAQARAEAARQATWATDAPRENPNLPMELGDPRVTPADEPTARQTFNPVTPPSAWSIRGLLSSIERPLARLMEGFGRRRTAQEPEVPEAHGASGMPTAPDAPVSPQPSSGNGLEQVSRREVEQTSRAPSDVTPSRPRVPRKSRSKARSKTTSEATPSRRKATPKSRSKKSSTAAAKARAQTTPSSPSNIAPAATSEVTPKTTPQSQPAKKRKRAPSPDVIPNPPGCSYGLHPDYFYYTESDEEPESTSQNEPSPSKNSSVMPKSAIRSSAPTSKRVRFDASPQDSPSKIRRRPCATDPYTGRHFLGIGEEPHTPTRTDGMLTSTTASNLTTTPAIVSAPGPIATPPDRASNLTTTPATVSAPGPIAVPRPDRASNLATAPASVPAPGSTSTPRPDTAPTPEVTAASPEVSARSTQSIGQSEITTPGAVTGPASDRTASRPSRSASSHAPPPLPPKTPTKADDEPLAKVRSQAEKFKPKTPSGLRTASRYSSPLTRSSDMFLNQQQIPDFGDDEFGRDAQWLYEQCPTGNLDTLTWPSRHNVVTAIQVDAMPRQLLTRTWNNLEADENHSLFSKMMEMDDEDLIE